MRTTFLVPAYLSGPSGGCEYENRLARSGNNFTEQYTRPRSTDLLQDFIIRVVDHKPISRRPASTVQGFSPA